MALNHSPSIVSDGLIFYLDAANKQSFSGSGTAWRDLTSNNNTTLVNSPTYTASNGGYFSFNGTNQEVTTTLAYTGFHLTSFTLCGWFRTSVASGKKIIGFESVQTGTPVTRDKHVYITTSGTLAFGVANGGLGRIITSAVSHNDNMWHNFAATHTIGTGIELFVDGVSQGTLPYTSTDTNNRYIRIAGYSLTSAWIGGSTGYLTGDISALSLYSRTLSTAEIQNNFNALKGRYNV